MTVGQQMIEYFQANMDTYFLAVRQHFLISISALFVACLLGIPCGCFAMKHEKAEKWLSGFFQILRIIPSLAILILLIPVMGTGEKPAMAALVLLAVPPILMNTVAGLKDVPDFLLETAGGIGMTEFQQFWKVQFPLAFPMIFAGIKTAMVEIIASATLAAKIGAGGLGEMIFTGLGLNRTDLLLIGGFSVAGLSLFVGMFLTWIGNKIFAYS